MMSRYSHHEDVSGVWGYVVNVHDAVNYDIDLDFSSHPELSARYNNVIMNKYLYYEYSEIPEGDFLEDLGKNATTGITYRCRLKGIGTTQCTQDKRKGKKRKDYILRDAHIAMIRQFDRCNGWVLCTLSDVDIYRRLLVTLHHPKTKEPFSDILLSYPYDAMFCPYGTTENTKRISDGVQPNSPISDSE